jgi:aminotransferase EvaB
VIGVANGTDALELALRASGVVPGDRVLLPSHTAYATAAAVLRLEARPVFVDLEPGRPVLAVSQVAALLGAAAAEGDGEGRVRAVIAVHLYGEACDLVPLLSLCEQHGVALIEDCAQACGPLVGLPHTERCVAEILTLPLHPYLEQACVDDLVRRLLPLLA